MGFFWGSIVQCYTYYSIHNRRFRIDDCGEKERITPALGVMDVFPQYAGIMH